MKKYTHIIAILDKSGSMAPIIDDTIGGFNTFLEEQKSIKEDATLTLVQFNDKCETIYSDVPLKHAAPLTRETFVPKGWTSLNDALATVINQVGLKLASKPEHERPSKVMFLILTDGAENTSKEFGGEHGLAKLSGMIKHQSEKYSWNFTFLGANLDSQKVAIKYNISAANSINFSSDGIGTRNAFKSMSRGMATARLSDLNSKSYFIGEINKTKIDNTILDNSDIQTHIDKLTK